MNKYIYTYIKIYIYTVYNILSSIQGVPNILREFLNTCWLKKKTIIHASLHYTNSVPMYRFEMSTFVRDHPVLLKDGTSSHTSWGSVFWPILTPRNIPKTPSEKVFGCLGLIVLGTFFEKAPIFNVFWINGELYSHVPPAYQLQV